MMSFQGPSGLPTSLVPITLASLVAVGMEVSAFVLGGELVQAIAAGGVAATTVAFICGYVVLRKR